MEGQVPQIVHNSVHCLSPQLENDIAVNGGDFDESGFNKVVTCIVQDQSNANFPPKNTLVCWIFLFHFGSSSESKKIFKDQNASR